VYVANLDSSTRESDSADFGAAQTGGYSPAEAAHAVEQYLEGRLPLGGLEDWLRGYPYAPNGPQPDDVEDLINRATLAVRAHREGRYDVDTLRRELRDLRGRLSGIAFSEGQLPSGSRVDPTGKPIDRSFP
jgi:hypothetical protein